MNTVDLWLGDSWTIGSELNLTSKQEVLKGLPTAKVSKRIPHVSDSANPMLAYAGIISQEQNRKFYNFGKSGGSFQFMLYELIRYIKNFNNPDTQTNVFVQTTGQIRWFAGQSFTTIGHHQTGWDVTLVDDLTSPHSITRFQNIAVENVRDYEKTLKDIGEEPDYSIYNTTIVLNNIYSLCKQYNFNLSIIPVWVEFEMFDQVNLIPDDVWLLPHNKTILEEVTGKKFLDILDDPKYIIEESLGHPNKETHKLIADYISSCLY